eukprot:4574608-Karenia_brevis.AAC.1
MGAQACQLTEAETRPILKKDSVLWQLQSRMVASVQQLPSRRVAQGTQLSIIRPTARDHLEAKGHQLAENGLRLCCHMCGEEWAKGKQGVGGECPGPAIWGVPPTK